jgi:hypothetical protein
MTAAMAHRLNLWLRSFGVDGNRSRHFPGIQIVVFRSLLVVVVPLQMCGAVRTAKKLGFWGLEVSTHHF